MRNEAIFGPVSALALWTGGVLLFTGSRRVGAVRAGRISRNAFRLGESVDVPDDVVVVNRNLMNLLEMPMLFYVVCIAFYVTRNVGTGVVAAGWTYVALRVLHSWIHLTSNHVLARLGVFAASNFLLLGLWLSFIWYAL